MGQQIASMVSQIKKGHVAELILPGRSRSRIKATKFAHHKPKRYFLAAYICQIRGINYPA